MAKEMIYEDCLFGSNVDLGAFDLGELDLGEPSSITQGWFEDKKGSKTKPVVEAYDDEDQAEQEAEQEAEDEEEEHEVDSILEVD